MDKIAELMVAFYRVKDSDNQAIDYFQRLETMTNICLENFQVQKGEENPIISLFLIQHSLEQNILSLDLIGLEDAANQLQEMVIYLDSNLRAIVSKMTTIDVTNEQSVDLDFLNQFNANVFWLDSYKNKIKKKR